MSNITIRTVPSLVNPTPRPSTPGRPSTSSNKSLSRKTFENVFDTDDSIQTKTVFDDVITEDYLRRVANAEDLNSVTTIKLEIDTSYQSLLDIGDFLTRLDHLTLDSSKIASIRDLGVGLKYLKSLSVNDCGLSELDGIGMLTNLEKLSARDNNIEDVTALALHDSIQDVDLHRNKISDISVADTLSSCPMLHHLTLSGNSIERAPKYRLVVAAMIPQLETLDGDVVDRNAKNKVSNGMILEAASAMQLEQEELDDERRMEMAFMSDDMLVDTQPLSVPAHELKLDNNNDGNNKGSVCSLPDNGSDLTHGSAVVLAGSMASAIRRRRNMSPRAASGGSQQSIEDKRHMSALETLDSAAVMSENDDHDKFYGEGDVTKAYRKQEKALKAKAASSPRKSQYRNKNKKKPNSESLDVNVSESSGSSVYPKDLTNPVAAAIISAAHSQNATSFEYDSSEERQVNRKTRVSGTSPSGWASRPMSRGASRRSNPSRSPSPGAEARRPPRSPPTWQRNASRPQSTASSGRGSASGIAGGIAPSAPFKVSSLKTTGEEPTPHPRGGAEVLPSVCPNPVGDGETLRRQGSHDGYSSSEDEEFRGRNRRRPMGSPGICKKGSVPLVKKDNVLRGLLFSDEDSASGRSSKPALPNDDSHDHNENSNNLMGGNNFPSSRSQLQSSHSHRSTSDSDVQESSINLTDCVPSSEQTSSRESSSSERQLSEVATRSLGFDLKGSLAAINQWVDDQDSDDDDEEEDGPSSGKYSDVWSMRNERKRAATAQKKILSRDKILGMCTGVVSSEHDSAARLTADNLAINDYCRGYSRDERDEDENSSDCHENEVIFYDNNIDKTSDSLTKSCSLLTIGGVSNHKTTSKKKDDNEQLFFSKSLSIDKSKPPSSPRRTKRSIAQSESSTVLTESPIVASSRGCTPSTSTEASSVPDNQNKVDAASPRNRHSIEAQVRHSPSDDPSTVASSSKHNSRAKKCSKESVVVDGVADNATAKSMSDEQLVQMLSQPPKAVPLLKTKSGFQDFFRGVSADRMQELLKTAYKDMTDLDRDSKVKKRMELLRGVLAE